MSARAAAVLACLLGAGACVSDLETERAHFALARAQGVHRGMTKDEVVAALGRPHHMSQQEVVGTKQVIAEVWTWFEAYTQTSYLVGFGVDDRVVKTETQRPRQAR